MVIKIKNLEKEPLQVLVAIALSYARDIDRGQKELQPDLEHVMSLVPNAKREGMLAACQ